MSSNTTADDLAAKTETIQISTTTTAIPTSPSTTNGETVPQVLIIGGGYAGCVIGRALEPEMKAGRIKLTIIERRDSFHHKIGAIRASVLGKEYVERIRIPLKNILKYSKIVEGSVREVNSETDSVELEDGSTIKYDVLICATGTTNHSSGDLPPALRGKDAIREYFKAVSDAVQKADRICIAGGGPTAVEYAGEIRAAYPGKKVTMICSSPHLLSSCVAQPPGKFMSKLYEKLNGLGIELLRGEKVVSPSPDNFAPGQKFIQGPVTVKTNGEKGYEMEFDLVIWAATWTLNNAMYPAEWLNSAGELNVADNFQVSGCDKGNVFAFGDVCSIAETKQAITLQPKVKYLAHNVVSVASALRKLGGDKDLLEKNMPRLKNYSWTDKVVLYLPIGPKHGVSQIGGWTYSDAKTRKWKGEDLYTEHFWKQLTGNPPPPKPVDSK